LIFGIAPLRFLGTGAGRPYFDIGAQAAIATPPLAESPGKNVIPFGFAARLRFRVASPRGPGEAK
jgi:hypothetical protein